MKGLITRADSGYKCTGLYMYAMMTLVRIFTVHLNERLRRIEYF